MDILIPLINCSKAGDAELRFALRSIEKHLTGFERIIIVGHLPSWLSGVVHIPFKDKPGKKQENIRNKILAGLEVSSDTVLFFNDDHFLLRDFEIQKFPYFYSGMLNGVAEKGAKPLIKQLEALSLPSKWFDGHFPILYQKQAFKEALNHFSGDCIIKSAYANYQRIEGEYCPDLKINSNLGYERILQAIKDRPVFSVGDYGCSIAMRRVWDELYPMPSRYETAQLKKSA